MFAKILILYIVSWWHHPEGKKIVCVTANDFYLQRDTVIATHYHRVDSKFYVITIDKTEIWCDYVKEIINE